MLWEGGNNQALAGAGHGDGRGEVLVIAGVRHHRDFDDAQGGDVRNRRAGDAAKEHRRQDVHMRQAAGEPADADVCELEQPLRDAAGGHQLAHQDEEGDGQQRKGVELLAHLLRHGHDGNLQVQHGQARGHHHRECNRAFEHHEHKKGNQQNSNRDGTHYAFTPFPSSFCMPSMCMMTK